MFRATWGSCKRALFLASAKYFWSLFLDFSNSKTTFPNSSSETSSKQSIRPDRTSSTKWLIRLSWKASRVEIDLEIVSNDPSDNVQIYIFIYIYVYYKNKTNINT